MYKVHSYRVQGCGRWQAVSAYMVVDVDEWPRFNVEREELTQLMQEWDKYWPGVVESLALIAFKAVEDASTSRG